MLRCINHLEALNSGTIYIEGQPVYRYMRDGRLVVDKEKRIEQIRSQVGMVFQSFNLFPHFTALENIMVSPLHVPPHESRLAELRPQAFALMAKARSIRQGRRPIRMNCRGDSSNAGSNRARRAMRPKCHVVRRGDVRAWIGTGWRRPARHAPAGVGRNDWRSS